MVSGLFSSSSSSSSFSGSWKKKKSRQERFTVLHSKARETSFKGILREQRNNINVRHLIPNEDDMISFLSLSSNHCKIYEEREAYRLQLKQLCSLIHEQNYSYGYDFVYSVIMFYSPRDASKNWVLEYSSSKRLICKESRVDYSPQEGYSLKVEDLSLPEIIQQLKK